MGSDAEPIRVALLASNTGLTALRVVAKDGHFAEQACVLDDIPTPLQGPWSRLSEKHARLSVQTYVDLMVLLLETAPAAPCTYAIGARALPKIAGAQRSAAHPRAYRGTKCSPPKPKQPTLGPLLGLRGDLQALARVLNVHLADEAHAGHARLQQLGYAPSAIAWALASLREARWFSTAFMRCMVPSLRGAAWSLVRETAALFNALGLDDTEGTRSAVARWFAINGPSRAPQSLAWLRWLGRCPVDDRPAFADRVAAEDAAAEPPHDDLVFGAGPSTSATQRLDFVLRARRNGMSHAYLRGAFTAQGLDTVSPDATQRDDPRFDPERTRALLERLERPALYASVWEACGILPGLSPALRQLASALELEVAATDERRKAAGRLLELWVGMRWNEQPRLERWSEGVFAAWPAMLAWLETFEREDERETAAHILDLAIEQLSTKEQLAQKLPALLTLVGHLARAKATTKLWIPIERLVANLSLSRLERWVNAPQRSHATLVRACRSTNESWRIRRGLLSIASAMPELFLRAYIRHPRTLMKTALAIGDARLAQRQTTLRRLAQHPELGASPAELRRPGRTNPMPRRLRDHLEGRICLSPGSLARHQRVMAELADLTALDTIRLFVERALARGAELSTLDPARAHALRIEGWVGANRRALRRLLSVPAPRANDYVFDHPRARQWLARHPALARKLELWRRGIVLVGHADDATLTLRVCQDPLETLRMGTYVGSCLGLGGDFMDAAAAAALDMNKRVVYARTSTGRVVGRQQLSWSEQGRLVCHMPYPLRATDSLKALFARYDALFAAALEVEIQAPATPYVIASVLSASSYDDGPWRDPPKPSFDDGDDLCVAQIGGRAVGLCEPRAAEVGAR